MVLAIMVEGGGNHCNIGQIRFCGRQPGATPVVRDNAEKLPELFHLWPEHRLVECPAVNENEGLSSAVDAAVDVHRPVPDDFAPSPVQG